MPCGTPACDVGNNPLNTCIRFIRRDKWQAFVNAVMSLLDCVYKQNKQSMQCNVSSVKCGAITGGHMTHIFSDDELPHA